MKIKKAIIRNFGSLKDVSFEGTNFLVLIGPNSSGKSLIFEALTKFFNEFTPIGGTSAVTDMLWFKRDVTRPIEFEITVELDEQEIGELIPLGRGIIDAVKAKFLDALNLTIKRSLLSDGRWTTNEVKWSQIELIINDTLVSHDKFQSVLQPLLSLSDYKMYFFTPGYSKENIGGDRLLVNLKQRKGLTSTPDIDELVKKGVIESSIEYEGKNWQEWVRENNITVASPTPADIEELGVIPPEILQNLITSLTKLRGKFKLIPAARDVKAVPGQRVSFLDPTILQTITSTSVDASSQASFRRWSKYREYTQKILGRQLEPNPTQVRVIDGDVGLFPAYIGGGDQSVLGLVWETMEADSIIAIEEPENHLHPELQRRLLDYLLEISAETQIIICTHSPIFASKPDIRSILLVSKDAEGATRVEPVDQTNVYRIINELGVKASDIFDFDTIVFVEGKTDVKIFEGFKQTLLSEKGKNVGFVDAGGWTNMEYFANAKILRSLKPPREIFAIFNGHIEKQEKIKERLLRELNIKNENIITLEESSIEAYLLVPSAIKRAFPNLRLSEEEISRIIERSKDKRNKKEILDFILRSGNVGSYDEEKAESIAKAMLENEINDEIKDLFKKILGEKSHA